MFDNNDYDQPEHDYQDNSDDAQLQKVDSSEPVTNQIENNATQDFAFKSNINFEFKDHVELNSDNMSQQSNNYGFNDYESQKD